MGTLDYKEHYKRSLPHFQPQNATFFVTFRLFGSIPREVIEQCREERVLMERQRDQLPDGPERECLEKQIERLSFVRYETALNISKRGPMWLKEAAVAEMTVASLMHRDGSTWELDAFCVMPNHVHLVFRPLKSTSGGDTALPKIMQSLKGYTAAAANKILGRTGLFWEHESYDRVIRDEDEWKRIVRYVLNNPVKAGLVDEWRKWRWSYFRLGNVEF